MSIPLNQRAEAALQLKAMVTSDSRTPRPSPAVVDEFEPEPDLTTAPGGPLPESEAAVACGDYDAVPGDARTVVEYALACRPSLGYAPYGSLQGEPCVTIRLWEPRGTRHDNKSPAGLRRPSPVVYNTPSLCGEVNDLFVENTWLQGRAARHVLIEAGGVLMDRDYADLIRSLQSHGCRVSLLVQGSLPVCRNMIQPDRLIVAPRTARDNLVPVADEVIIVPQPGFDLVAFPERCVAARDRYIIVPSVRDPEKGSVQFTGLFEATAYTARNPGFRLQISLAETIGRMDIPASRPRHKQQQPQQQ